MWAKQAVHLANGLLRSLLLRPGPILVLFVERGFHSSIRWRHTTEFTQVQASYPIQVVCFSPSTGLLAPKSVSVCLASMQLPCPLPGFTPRPAFPPSFLHQPSPPPATGEKPFSCGLCPQRSRDFSAMTKHLRTHGAAPYRCPLCGVGCPSLASMQAHMRCHSPSQLPPGWTIRSTFLYSSTSKPSRASTSL